MRGSGNDHREAKSMLDKLMAEAGVETQLHTRAVAVSKDGARLQGVFTASKSGFEFIEAGVVIDATGDGDIAAAAGCEYEMGRSFDGKTQPVTLFGTIGGYRGQPGQVGVFQLMATQFYGVDGTDVRDLTQAEIRGREQIRTCVATFKKHGSGSPS